MICGTAPTIRVVTPGSKMCQLIGDVDRATGQPTVNRTATRFGLTNTDLGATFEHDGRLWFFFGDSYPSGADAANPHCGDAIAWTTDKTPQGCVSLDFVSRPDDGGFQSPEVPTIDLGCWNVPLHGVSSGASMYAWFSTGKMTRSVLARSDDDARTFSLVGTLSDCRCTTRPECNDARCQSCENPSCHFINVSAPVVPEAQADGLPGSGDRVLLFGSGRYRMSDVFLAVTSLADIENMTAIEYFTGLDPLSCSPIWSHLEADAVPLFDTTNDNGNSQPPCVGELSVHYEPALNQWLAFYNCNDTISVVRAATSPWGPWSAAGDLFDSKTAYCKYLYEGDAGCPQLSDRPQRDNPLPNGHTYGPYAIASYSTPTPQGVQVFFTMSTANPYTVMLMTAELAASR
jgi:hypothetical protein